MTPAFPVTCTSSANSIRTLQTFTCNSCYCNYSNAKRGLPESAGWSNIVLNSRVSMIQLHRRLGPRIHAVDDSSANESDDNLRRKKSGLFLKAKLLYDHIRKLVKQFLQQHAVPVALSTAAGALFCICYLTSQLAQATPSPVLVPYSELVKNLNSGTVSSVLFEEGSRRIFFNNNNSATESKPAAAAAEESEKKSSRNSRFVRVLDSRILLDNIGSSVKWGYCTRRVENDETYLLGLMRECGVTYSSAPQPLSASMTKVLVTVLTVWIPLMPFMWLLHKQISANNSSVQRRSSRQQAVKFDDVAGVDAAKAELMEIVSCLKGAINYKKLGANLPKGVLLVGPPGTGKTLLARAVAGEAGVPFYASSASEFVELFVGRGAARIRDLFKVARKCAPSIIFIDELDAVGGRRGKSFNDERDQTLNQLLTEMDGFESNNGVLVIAATNRPEALDPAICRPGRFSRRVFVKEPDFDGRKKILAIYLRGIPCEEDPELLCNILASATSGFVGADLANVVNEAALLSARQGKDVVSLDCLKEAVHRARFGVGNNVGSTDFRKEIGKLFPWIQLKPSSDTENRSNELPAGYQTIT